MYNRHIEAKQNWVFINENDYVEMDTSLLPADVTFYCEYEGDWWIERNPFAGREKNEEIREIALEILAQAEEIWAEQEAIRLTLKEIPSNQEQ